MGDGYLGKCRDCTLKDAEANRRVNSKNPLWVKKEAERQRIKNKAMNHEFPEIATARRAVRKLGQSREFHWHHWSYSKENHVDVIRLTPKQHRLAHRFMIYDRERKQYRRCDTMELLDTREAHENFIKTLKY